MHPFIHPYIIHTSIHPSALGLLDSLPLSFSLSLPHCISISLSIYHSSLDHTHPPSTQAASDPHLRDLDLVLVRARLRSALAALDAAAWRAMRATQGHVRARRQVSSRVGSVWVVCVGWGSWWVEGSIYVDGCEYVICICAGGYGWHGWTVS